VSVSTKANSPDNPRENEFPHDCGAFAVIQHRGRLEVGADRASQLIEAAKIFAPARPRFKIEYARDLHRLVLLGTSHFNALPSSPRRRVPASLALDVLNLEQEAA
jgi:hypothetical protein